MEQDPGTVLVASFCSNVVQRASGHPVFHPWPTGRCEHPSLPPDKGTPLMLKTPWEGEAAVCLLKKNLSPQPRPVLHSPRFVSGWLSPHRIRQNREGKRDQLGNKSGRNKSGTGAERAVSRDEPM